MAPIFHGGTLKAQKRGAEADARAAAETYQQTVLEAFGQVSNLLSTLDTDGRALATQQEAAHIAERSLPSPGAALRQEIAASFRCRMPAAHTSARSCGCLTPVRASIST